MAENSRELQRIAGEISSTLKQLVSSNRTLVGSLTKDDDSKKGKRRPAKNGEPSPTASMNINRRLTGSIVNLTKQTNTASSDMIKFARALRNATNHVNSRNLKGGTSNASAVVADSQIANALSQLAREMREFGENNGNGGNRGNNDGGGTSRGDDGQTIGKQIANTIVGALEKYTLVGGATQMYREVQLASSRGAVYNFQTQQDSIMMGMSGTELIELQAQFRTSMMRATYGIDQWTSIVRQSQLDLISYTGTLQEAAKVSATLHQGLLNVGFTFDEATNIIGMGDNGLVGSLKRLSMVTGKTVLDLSEMVGNIISTNDGTELLRRMDRAQRRDYMLTQSRLLEHYTQLTGNIDRASEIISTQQRRANMDPVARHRESVKAMQAAIQTGMSHQDANELRTLMAMNPTQIMQDPVLNKRMTELAGTLHQNITELRGNNNLGVEWLGFRLDQWTKNANLEAFNIETDQPLSEVNMSEQMDRSISTAMDTNDILKESLVWLQRLEGLSKNILTAIVVGGAATLLRSAGFRKLIRGARDTYATEGGRRAVSSVTKSVMTSKAIRAGGIGLVTAGASYAIDKLVTPKTEEQERLKNTGQRALEFAGMGATIGTLIAGPIGTAVGGALGGVVGAVTGALQQTTDQARYEANALSARIDSDKFALQVTHQRTIDNLNTQYQHQQELFNSTSGEQKEQAQIRMNAIKEQIEKEKQLHNLRTEQVDKLSVATDALIRKLDTKRNLEDGFNEAFERGWNLKRQFDVGEFSQITNMTGSDIANSVAKYVDVPLDQLAELHSQLADPSSKIQNPELLAILEQWAAAYTKDVATQANEAQTEAEQARQRAAEAANATEAKVDERGNLITTPGENQTELFSGQLTDPIDSNFTTPTERAERRRALRSYHGYTSMGGMYIPPVAYHSVDPFTSNRRGNNQNSLSDRTSNMGRRTDGKAGTVDIINSEVVTVNQQNEEMNRKLDQLISATDSGWRSLVDVMNDNHRDNRQRVQQMEDNRNFMLQTDNSNVNNFQPRTVR